MYDWINLVIYRRGVKVLMRVMFNRNYTVSIVGVLEKELHTMVRLISISFLFMSLCAQSFVHAESGLGVLNKSSLELAAMNSRHTDSSYSKGRGIFIGFSQPLHVTQYGVTSLALDGGYANVGSISGEDEIGDPYSLRMTIIQMGLRGSAMLTDNMSVFAKFSAARVNPDSTDTTEDISLEGQLGLGFEWHLAKGLGLNMSYTQINSEVNSIMLGVTLR